MCLYIVDIGDKTGLDLVLWDPEFIRIIVVLLDTYKCAGLGEVIML